MHWHEKFYGIKGSVVWFRVLKKKYLADVEYNYK